MNKNTAIFIGIGLVLVIGIGYWAFAQNEALSPAPVVAVPSHASGTAPTGETPAQGSPAGAGEDTPGPASDPGPIGGAESPAVSAARANLAAKLPNGALIDLVKIEEQTWNDGCLGLGGAAESCLQALVEGYRLEFTAEGKTYVYRTDKAGTAVRQEIE